MRRQNMASLNSLDRRGYDRKTQAANNEIKTTRGREESKTEMEREESWYGEEVRSILGGLRRIVARMDDVYYNAKVRRESQASQFFVLNMITQARRLRNDWQRLSNDDESILEEFDRWKDQQICEKIQRRVQASGLEHKHNKAHNGIRYDKPR